MTEVEHPGQAWRRAIAESGLTQSKVAHAMGISPKHVNLIVNGKQTPSADLTVKFAEATGADATEMWKRSSDYMLEQTRNQLDAKGRTITVQETKLVPTTGGEGLLALELKVTIPAGANEDELMQPVAMLMVQMVGQIWPQEEE